MVCRKGLAVIGGGSGFVGNNLRRVLRNRGFDVQTISRCKEKGDLTWDQIEHKGLPSDTKYVINLAGKNIMDSKPKWGDEFKSEVVNSRVGTTKLLINTIKNQPGGIEAYICMSGIGIYEPHNQYVHDEMSPVREYDFLSKMCIDLEKSSKLTCNSPIRNVIIRCGVVLGTDGGMIKRLHLPFALGLGGPIAPGNQPLPWIHVNDLTKLIVFACENNIKGVLNGVAPHIITNQQFSNAFAKAMHRPALFQVPEFVMKMMVGDYRSKMLTQGPKVYPKRVIQLGFKYEFPTIESACEFLVQRQNDGLF